MDQSTGWKESTRTSIVLRRHSAASQNARRFVFDSGIKWHVCYCPAHHTRLKWLWLWRDVTTRTIFPYASKESSCPIEIPRARPKRHKTGDATTCSFSVCEMFDLWTSQRPVPLKTSGRFCRRSPRSCEQFSASNSSPGSSGGMVSDFAGCALHVGVWRAGRHLLFHHK